MKIRAILLDFWGTMVYPDIPIEKYFRRRAEYLRRVLEKHGYRYRVEDVYEKLLETRRLMDKVRSLSLREVTVLGEMVVFADKLGIRADESILRELSLAYIRPYYLFTKPADGLKDFILWADEAGLSLGLVSNVMYGRATRKILKRLGVQKYFKVVALSDEIGFRKPHAKIFLYALRRLRVKPDNAVMIGDEFCDIYGAKKLGLKTIQYIGFRNEDIGFEDFKARSFKEVKEYLEEILSPA